MKGGLKVRKVTEVERAARESAEELDAAMNESKVVRDRKKKERAVVAAAEREAERVVEARPVRTRLFTDGAARGNPGPAGAGAVIISPEGHVVAKMGKYLGETTNNVAEYTGLILGLKRAKAMGLRELDVLADSELIVKQLTGEYQVKADHLRPLHDEAEALIKGFDQIEVRHIPREENDRRGRDVEPGHRPAVCSAAGRSAARTVRAADRRFAGQRGNPRPAAARARLVHPFVVPIWNRTWPRSTLKDLPAELHRRLKQRARAERAQREPRGDRVPGAVVPGRSRSTSRRSSRRRAAVRERSPPRPSPDHGPGDHRLKRQGRP